MQLGLLTAKFEADVSEFIQNVGKAADAHEKMAHRMEAAMESVKIAFEAFAVEEVFRKIIEATAEAETAQTKLQAAVRQTGAISGVTASQVEKLASSFSELTGKSKASIENAEAILLRFTKISKETFPEALNAVTNLAAAMGGDLSAAATNVGKALEAPEKASKALRAENIILSASQTQLIKDFEKSGETIAAQHVVLDAISGAYGNAAAAARDTLAGAWTALGSATEELMVALGAGDKGGLRWVMEALIDLIEKLTIVVPAIGEAFVNVWHACEPVVDFLGNVLKTTLNNIIGTCVLVGKAFMGLVDIWGMVYKGFMEGWQELTTFFSEIEKGFQDFANTVMSIIAPIAKALEPIAKVMQSMTGQTIGALKDAAKPVTGAIADAYSPDYVKKGLDPISKWADDLNKKLEEQHDKAMQAGKGVASIGDNASLSAKEIEKLGKAFDKDLEKLLKPIKGTPSADPFVNDLKQRKLMGEKGGFAGWDASAQQNAKNGKDEEARDAILNSLDAEIDKKKAIAAQDQDAILNLEAQEKVQKLFPLDLQKQAEAHKQVFDLLKQEADLESQAKWDAKIQSMDDENSALAAKCSGLTSEYELQKQIAEVEKTMGLSPDERAKRIQQVKDEASAKESYNKILKDQGELTKTLGDNTVSLKDKEEALNKAWQNGTITMDQYNTDMQNLAQNSIKQVSKSVSDFTDTLLNNLTDAVTQGKSLTDVFKNMGIQLAKMTAEKFLFQPLSNAIGNIAGNLFGGTVFGGSPQQPGGAGNAAAGGGTGAAALGGGLLAKLFGLGSGGGAGSGLLGGGNKSGGAGGAGGQGGAGGAGGSGSNLDLTQLVMATPAGIAWKVAVVWPDLSSLMVPSGPLGGGKTGSNPGQIPGTFGGGGMPAGPMPFGANGFNPDGSPFIPGIPANYGKSNANPSKPYTTAYAGMAGAASNPNRTLSAAETQQAYQQAAMKSQQQSAFQYSQGLISGNAVLQNSASWNNSALTLNAMNYRASAAQAYGPAIQQQFSLQGSPYAGNTAASGWEEDSPSAPIGLSGGVNKSPMYAGWNAGGSGNGITEWGGGSPVVATNAGTGVKEYFAGPDWSSDNTKQATAYLWGSGGGGTSTGRNYSAPGQNSYGYTTPGVNTTGRSPIFGMADGGNPTPGLPQLVGERGPEMFVPSQPGTVVPNPATMAALNGAGGMPDVHLVNNTGAPISTGSISMQGGSLQVAISSAIQQLPNNPRFQRAQGSVAGTRIQGNRRG